MSEFDDIFAAYLKDNKRIVVASLLLGNDACCFSTQQYAERYAKLCWGNDEAMGLRLLLTIHDNETLAYKHLREYHPVMEIESNIWVERQYAGNHSDS